MVYLIAISVSANDNWLLPAGDKTRDVLANDGLTEDSATKNVTDGAIGRAPHLLQVEFLG